MVCISYICVNEGKLNNPEPNRSLFGLPNCVTFCQTRQAENDTTWMWLTPSIIARKSAVTSRVTSGTTVSSNRLEYKRIPRHFWCMTDFLGNSPSGDADSSSTSNVNSPHFMKHTISLPCSQKPYNYLYTEKKLIRSITYHPISLTPFLILSVYLRSDLPRGLFPSGFSILSLLHHTCFCARSLSHLQTCRTCRGKSKVSIPDSFRYKAFSQSEVTSVPAVRRKPRRSSCMRHKSVHIGKDAVLSDVALRRSVNGYRWIHKTCRLCLTGQRSMKALRATGTSKTSPTTYPEAQRHILRYTLTNCICGRQNSYCSLLQRKMQELW